MTVTGDCDAVIFRAFCDLAWYGMTVVVSVKGELMRWTCAEVGGYTWNLDVQEEVDRLSAWATAFRACPSGAPLPAPGPHVIA